MPNPSSPRRSADMLTRSSFRKRRGGILMSVAAGMTTLVGFGALVCDVGLAFAQRTRMQTAADAAALAAA
ncbi:MAG: pilus assembly protein TadG-related protein, partial [Candidatus Sericytochromatia bacterium]